MDTTSGSDGEAVKGSHPPTSVVMRESDSIREPRTMRWRGEPEGRSLVGTAQPPPTPEGLMKRTLADAALPTVRSGAEV